MDEREREKEEKAVDTAMSAVMSKRDEMRLDAERKSITFRPRPAMESQLLDRVRLAETLLAEERKKNQPDAELLARAKAAEDRLGETWVLLSGLLGADLFRPSRIDNVKEFTQIRDGLRAIKAGLTRPDVEPKGRLLAELTPAPELVGKVGAQRIIGTVDLGSTHDGGASAQQAYSVLISIPSPGIMSEKPLAVHAHFLADDAPYPVGEPMELRIGPHVLGTLSICLFKDHTQEAL